MLINSCINTVLPTPAPPNKPILPPFAYGSIKSITLIPVYKISLAVLRSSNNGGLACIGRPPTLLTCGNPSMASPVTLNKRPLIPSPTGIEIGIPVSVTTMPRTKPSVPSIAMVRTLS